MQIFKKMLTFLKINTSKGWLSPWGGTLKQLLSYICTFYDFVISMQCLNRFFCTSKLAKVAFLPLPPVTQHQGWEFALSLICSSLYCSKLLKLKSDLDRFAQVALLKKATMSNSLRLLMDKEQIAHFFSKSLNCSQKTSDSLKINDERIPNPAQH